MRILEYFSSSSGTAAISPASTRVSTAHRRDLLISAHRSAFLLSTHVCLAHAIDDCADLLAAAAHSTKIVIFTITTRRTRTSVAWYRWLALEEFAYLLCG